MKRHIGMGMAVLGLLVLAGCSSSKPTAEELMFFDLPQPVQKTVGEHFPRARMESIERLTWKDGVTWYRITLTYHGATRTILLTPEGETPKEQLKK